jgi:RES domain-containing protein
LALPANLPSIRVKAIVYRVVRDGVDPLGTVGSLKAGGRFNPPDEFAALYTSFDPATATKEVARGLKQRGIDPSQFPPGSWWVYELEVEIEAVLDLTSPDILQRIEVKSETLTGADIQVPRSIAVEAREKGFGALLVPSAADPESKNLVIFLDKLPGTPNVLSSRAASVQE